MKENGAAIRFLGRDIQRSQSAGKAYMKKGYTYSY